MMLTTCPIFHLKSNPEKIIQSIALWIKSYQLTNIILKGLTCGSLSFIFHDIFANWKKKQYLCTEKTVDTYN